MGRRAALLILVLGLVTGCAASGGSSTPLAASASPETTPAQTGVATTSTPTTAEEIVDDPDSRLVEHARGGGGAVATGWRWCPSRRCHRARYAVAVSGDGFETRAVPDLPSRSYPRLHPAGRAFVVVQGRTAWLLDVHGSLSEVAVERARPAGPGEVVLGVGDRWVAVDPAAARAHAVPTPEDVRQLWQDDSELRGITYPARGRARYVWSDDGGRTWQSTRLPEQRVLWSPQTEVPGVALVAGGDGATLLPFGALHRYEAGTDTWTTTPGPTDPTAYSVSTAVRPDGRLLMTVPLWSDARRDRVRTRPGVWVSTDETWTDFERVEPGRPFDDGVFQPEVLDLRRTGGAVEVTVIDAAQGGWRSRDAGRSWQPVALR